MADEDWGASDAEKSDDEGTEGNTEPTTLLIAIDTDASMFASDSSGLSIFKGVLISCYEILDSLLLKVRRARKNIIALAIVSDDKEKLTVSTFKDLLPETLKKLRSLCDKSDKELKDLYLRTDPLDMSDFFIHCKKMFTQSNMDSIKYIVYITNADNPMMDDEDKKFHAVNQAKTLRDFNIYIELLTFNQNFDYSLFFHEILAAALSKFNYEYFTDHLCLKEKLLSMMVYKGHKIKFFPFHGDKKYFEVIEKSYLKPLKILNNVTVTKDTNKEVKKLKKGATHTNRYKVRYSKTDTPLEFNANERNLLLSDDVPVGLALLSVSPKLIQPGMHNTDPKFIQSIGKEDVYFSLFWQYCVDKNRVLLCTRKARIHTRPRLVELSPKVINNIRCFLVLGFPFQDNIEMPEETYDEERTPLVDAERELQATEDFVKALTFTYEPTMFHNLGYCKKRDYIRSQLLDEPPTDNWSALEIKEEVKTEAIDEVINKFKETCFVEVTAKKRKNVSEKSEKTQQVKSRKKK